MKNDEVVIREVMLRDGLQNIVDFIPTEAKIELFRLIVASGLRSIEVTSFVSPKAIPQFRDAAQVVQAAAKITPPGVEVSALIPNLKGAQLAIESGMRKVGLVMSVSESHNINNVRRTTAESIAAIIAAMIGWILGMGSCPRALASQLLSTRMIRRRSMSCLRKVKNSI